MKKTGGGWLLLQWCEMNCKACWPMQVWHLFVTPLLAVFSLLFIYFWFFCRWNCRFFQNWDWAKPSLLLQESLDRTDNCPKNTCQKVDYHSLNNFMKAKAAEVNGVFSQRAMLKWVKEEFGFGSFWLIKAVFTKFKWTMVGQPHYLTLFFFLPFTVF